MALGFLYTCSCGRRFKAYVPKQKMFQTMTGRTVDWARIDRRDQDDGSIDEVKRQAVVAHCSFVDIRGGERLTCPTCAREVDLVKHFRSVMMDLTHPKAMPPARR